MTRGCEARRAFLLPLRLTGCVVKRPLRNTPDTRNDRRSHRIARKNANSGHFSYNKQSLAD